MGCRIVQDMVERLCGIIENRRVHSRVHATALRMIHFVCLRRDWPCHTPVRVAKIVFDACLSEINAVRQCGYLLMRMVLQLNKIPSLKTEQPLYQLCLYNSNLFPECFLRF